METNRPTMYRFSFIAIFCCLFVNLSGFAQNAPVIENRRELFVDDYIIDKLDGISFRIGEPLSAGSVMTFSEPWEGQFSFYVSLVFDGSLYRMYYRGLTGYENKGDQQVTCYAISVDGKNWVKPNLGLFKVNGTWDNNVVMMDNAEGSTHNFTVLYDTNNGVRVDEKFKAIGGIASKGLSRYVSGDGVHWKRVGPPEGLFKGKGLDSQNVLAWVPSENQYAIYFRLAKDGVRSISRSVSKDWHSWSEAKPMEFGGAPKEHLYTNATQSYFRAPHILMAMPFRLLPATTVLSPEELEAFGIDPTQRKGVADAVLMSSRGGYTYDRKFMESFVRPGVDGRNWAARSNGPALGVVPTGETEMSFYVTRAYGTDDVYLERMVLRHDGFASLHADYAEGRAVTKPLILKGDKLLLNYSASTVGYVKLVLLDEKGREIEGFGEASAAVMTGDRIDAPVVWPNGKTIRNIANTMVRIKFIARDADIYSFGVFNE
jgi:hypothetical protein